MPLNMRTPGGTDKPSAYQFPISRGFAITVLLALLLLIALRHMFGSVRLEAGVS